MGTSDRTTSQPKPQDLLRSGHNGRFAPARASTSARVTLRAGAGSLWISSYRGSHRPVPPRDPADGSEVGPPGVDPGAGRAKTTPMIPTTAEMTAMCAPGPTAGPTAG